MGIVREIQAEYKEGLSSLYEEAELDQIILRAFEHSCAFSRADLILRSAEKISAPEATEMKRILSELVEGIPIQYILGYTWFFDRKMTVSPAVLIPRPETEELLRWIINDYSPSGYQDIHLMDVCTGSGCIAASLAVQFPAWKIHGLDISQAALDIASINVKDSENGVELLLADFLHWRKEPLLQHFIGEGDNRSLDIIVSNPPYVTPAERLFMHSRVLEHEPEIALFVPSEDPLIFYREIAAFAAASLKPGGKVYVEINRAFGKEMIDLFAKYHFTDIRLKKDMYNKDRMISASL